MHRKDLGEGRRKGWERGDWEKRERVLPSSRLSGRNVRYKHLARDFKVEQKVFILEVEDKSLGERICLTERTRFRGFQISFDWGCASWLSLQIKTAITASARSFFRLYRGLNYQFWVESFNNKNGIFLVLSKSENQGLLRKIIVPKGANFFGWRKMEELLSEILRGGKKGGVASGTPFQSKRLARREAPEPPRIHSCVVPQLSYKDAVLRGIKATNLVPNAIAGEKIWIEKSRTKSDKSPEAFNWGSVIVCERQVVHQPWREVEDSLLNIMGRKASLVPFQCNKALFVCKNEEEAAQIAQIGVLSMIGYPEVVLSGWWESIKPSERKVVSYGGWIALEGLPPHLWTSDFFHEIGDACGGLVEIDRKTADFEFLLEAKIRIKQNNTGFIPEFVEVADGDFVVRVKIRQITPARRPKASVAEYGESRHLKMSRRPLKAELKTQKVNGLLPPAMAISNPGNQSCPSVESRACFQIGEFKCPITMGSDRKQGVLSGEKLTDGGRSKELEVYFREKQGVLLGEQKLSEGGSSSPSGKFVRVEEGLISNDGDYFNLSKGLSSTVGGISNCLEKDFYIHEEVASGFSTHQGVFNINFEGKVGCGPIKAYDGQSQVDCGSTSDQKIFNVFVGGKDGSGPHKVCNGHIQIGAFLGSPQRTISLELFGLNPRAYHGNEVMVMPNFQSVDLFHTVQMASERSTSRAHEKGIEATIICSNLKFIAKFGDLANVSKRFKLVYPKEFGSRLNLNEEDTPKKIGASNLLSPDDDSDQDEEMEELLGHNPLCVTSVAERMESVIGNISSTNFFPTVDVDYLAQITHAEEDDWSQVSESEVKLGDSSQDEKANFDPIESGEGILQNLFSDGDEEMISATEEEGTLRDYRQDLEVVEQNQTKENDDNNNVLKYSRRKRSVRVSDKWEPTGGSSEFLSNMKISLLPLKKSLFLGKSSGVRVGRGEKRKSKRGLINLNEDN
ncbi:hypothetical protein ACFX11_028259 [Malus domestica]